MMEDNFRNVLIIISAIVIAAIFVHGFWTIRKNKNPYKLKAKNEKVDPIERTVDHSGFDQDGVGQVRVVSQHSLSENETPSAPAPAPDYDEEPLPKDLSQARSDEPSLEPTLGDLSDIAEQPPLDNPPPHANTFDEAPVQEDKPVYETPVTKAKPEAPKKRSVRKTVSEKLKRNQMEMNFGDVVAPDDVPSMSASEPAKKPEPELEPEVIVVSVVMPEGHQISGAALLPTLLTLGLRFGDMNIFHRHEDNAGNGQVTFSLANMMNPGTFDLDNMESFSTQGITLFMTLPNAGDPFEIFSHMMQAAKQLAVEFNAQLLDDKRSVMTKQTEQHYISRIREYDRKSRIAAV